MIAPLLISVMCPFYPPTHVKEQHQNYSPCENKLLKILSPFFYSRKSYSLDYSYSKRSSLFAESSRANPMNSTEGPVVYNRRRFFTSCGHFLSDINLRVTFEQILREGPFSFQNGEGRFRKLSQSHFLYEVVNSAPIFSTLLLSRIWTAEWTIYLIHGEVPWEKLNKTKTKVMVGSG